MERHGSTRRMKKIRETILPGICQTMSNPIGHQPHRTPTTSTYPRPATPLVDNDGQQREEPGSMLPQPAFTTAMLSLSALENDIGPLIDPAPVSPPKFSQHLSLTWLVPVRTNFNSLFVQGKRRSSRSTERGPVTTQLEHTAPDGQVVHLGESNTTDFVEGCCPPD